MGKWKEARDRRRLRNGLITMGVIVLVLAVASVFVAKRYKGVVELRRGHEARVQMMEIVKACKEFEYSQGFWPEKIHQLEQYDFIHLRDDLWEEWYFTLEPGKVIQALSTNRNTLVGPGIEMFYHVDTDTWTGYGIPGGKVVGDPELIVH